VSQGSEFIDSDENSPDRVLFLFARSFRVGPCCWRSVGLNSGQIAAGAGM